MRTPSSCGWPAWPCLGREVTGQSTVAVTRSRLLQRVQRSSGQFNAGRGRGQINVLTGAVQKKARARRYRGRLTSVCVLCCRPRGMLEAASSGASGSASFGRFQVTASDFGVERRSSVEGGQQDPLESIVSFVAVCSRCAVNIHSSLSSCVTWSCDSELRITCSIL